MHIIFSYCIKVIILLKCPLISTLSARNKVRSLFGGNSNYMFPTAHAQPLIIKTSDGNQRPVVIYEGWGREKLILKIKLPNPPDSGKSPLLKSI